MARVARMVLPGVPHPVTQRGNRREQTSFEDGDYALHLDLLAEGAERAGVELWSYCPMPNPRSHHRRAARCRWIGPAFRHVHRHYTGYINARLRVTGHVWRGRFSSVAMDEEHLHAAVRYVALNLVRARLVTRAEDWQWSSARAHSAGCDDHVVRVAPVLERVGDFRAFLGEAFDEAFAYAALRKAESLGRPIGSREWLAEMEARTGLSLIPAKRGPKPKAV